MLREFVSFLFCLSALGAIYNVNAQVSPCNIRQWESAKNFSSGSELYSRIAYDKSNNLYITGYFNEYADFGDTVLISPGYASFLVKYNEIGSLVWAEVLEEGAKVAEIAISGNSLFLLSTHPKNPDKELWSIALYNLNGEKQWSRSPKSFADGFSFRLTTDGAGNAYIGGAFYDFIQFENDLFTTKNIYGDGFIAKYSNRGEFQWAKQLPYSTIYDLATNKKGEVYAAGTFENTITFAGDTIDLYGSSYWGGIYFKLSSKGEELLYNYVAKAPIYSILNSIAVDKEDNVIVGGFFESTSTSAEDTATSYIGSDKFTLNHSMVVKYNKGEEYVWSDTVESGIHNTVGSIAIDSSGNIYLAVNTLEEHMLVKYNFNGNRLWELPVTNLGTYYACFDIALYPDNESLSVTGNYNHETQFGDLSLTPTREGDVYLARLNASSVVSAPLQASANIQLTDLTGTSAHVTWENGDGTGRLVLLKKLGQVSPSHITDGKVYDDGEGIFEKGSQTDEGEYVVYIGTRSETTLSGLQPGSPYQVSVIEYNVSDTCPSLTNYLQETTEKSTFLTPGNQPQFSAYPNPITGNILAVQLPVNTSETTALTLTDAFGKQLVERKIKNFSESNGEVKIDVAALNLFPGVYYLNLPGQSPIRLIKK